MRALLKTFLGICVFFAAGLSIIAMFIAFGFLLRIIGVIIAIVGVVGLIGVFLWFCIEELIIQPLQKRRKPR
jgi:hypothetical protein